MQSAPPNAFFHWPVGTPDERIEFDKLPGAWVTATTYCQRYNATGAWAIHTGHDLNLNFDVVTGKPHFDLDAHSPVWAAGDGLVKFADKLPVWGLVIVIYHVVDGRQLWTRYAHGEALQVKAGDEVKRGDQLARVGNADGRYPYHLHYDMATRDLGSKPGDWPGDNLPRVQRDYLDPIVVMREQMTHAPVPEGAQQFCIIAEPTLRVRNSPSLAGNIVGQLRTDAIVNVLEVRDGWGRIEQPVTGWIMLRWAIKA